MSSWETTLAAWSPVDPHADTTSAAVRESIANLRARLAAVGAIAVGPVELELSRLHNFAPGREIVLAEVRALVLRNPNPFPRIRLFRWLPK